MLRTGGYHTTDSDGFLRSVSNSSVSTLLTITEKIVLSETNIHFDERGTCSDIRNIRVGSPYLHCRVNHSHNFVDPVRAAHTVCIMYVGKY